jgi:D-alanyl-D-alanine carboxypeptidase/D-alanyl-D-alanine carboxypeptidase (penicillin-binding protein 5/6)
MRARFGNPPYDRWLVNHNKLLNYYEHTVGVKTGFTRAAGRCLVSAAERDGITLIVVTLNCPDDWNIHEYLYERFFPTLELRDLSQGLALPQIPVVGGTQPYVGTTKAGLPMFPVPAEGANIEFHIFAPAFLYAPVRSGQPVGHVEISVDGKTLATLSIVVMSDVALLHPYRERQGFFERIGDFFTGLV